MVAFPFNGFAEISAGGWLAITALFTHLTIISVTVFLHRSQAHRALDLHPILSHAFRFWLWFTTGMSTKAWVAIHRKHHAYSDRVGDPHSPHVLGIGQVLWYGAEWYRLEAHNPATLEQYGAGTPDDWIENKLYTAYPTTGLLLMALVYVTTMGVPGLITAAIQMAWIPLWAAGVINGIGHYWGYRNFECKDASRNIVPWGILIGGEELHNNHHAFGTSAKFSVKWWEIDLGWWYIRLFSALGLATVRRVFPRPGQAAAKNQIDLETVKAVIVNRLHILSAYTDHVVLPIFKRVCQDMRKNLPASPRRLRHWLIRERSLVAESEWHCLQEWLQHTPTLKQVYEFRLRLQAIWEKTSASHKELIDALQQWCHEAEKSGIEALQHFASTIRCYA